MSQHSPAHIVQIKVRLLGVAKPPVWRRVQLRADTRLDRLHEILVEDLLDPDPDTHYPILVTGKGACPPEDCGGAWGYADLKAILANPNDHEHRARLEWLGLNHAGEFDPAALPTDDIDYEFALSGASR